MQRHRFSADRAQRTRARLGGLSAPCRRTLAIRHGAKLCWTSPVPDEPVQSGRPGGEHPSSVTSGSRRRHGDKGTGLAAELPVLAEPQRHHRTRPRPHQVVSEASPNAHRSESGIFRGRAAWCHCLSIHAEISIGCVGESVSGGGAVGMGPASDGGMVMVPRVLLSVLGGCWDRLRSYGGPPARTRGLTARRPGATNGGCPKSTCRGCPKST